MRTTLAGISKSIVAVVIMTLAFGFAAFQRDGKPPQASMPPHEVGYAQLTSVERGTGAAISSCLIIPVEGVRAGQLADTFGDARNEGRRHDAIDIMAPLGTPVIAAASGWVEKVFQSRAGGNTVYVRSPDGRTIYYYAHLDRYAPGLRNGQTLKQGELIGEVGYSGNADPAAPHLHLAIWATDPSAKWSEPATALNPYPMLTTRLGC